MDLKAFFDAARAKPFNKVLSQSAVDGCQALIAAFAEHGDGDKRKLAYILGTAFHESDRFQTMEEYASGQAYEGRADLGNTEAGDGKRFKGRGFVQVTGRRNYADWSRRLGINLLADPEVAEKRPIAARICVQGMMLGTFTGKKLGDYISERSADYVGARRVVNGTDKAVLIAGYAREFEAALNAGSFEATAPAPVPVLAAVEAAPDAPTPILATIPVQASDPIAAISKAVGAAKGGAIGALASTGGMTSIGGLLSAANWLPTLSTTQLLVIFGGLTALVAIILCAGFAFWRAYQAPANQP